LLKVSKEVGEVNFINFFRLQKLHVPNYDPNFMWRWMLVTLIVLRFTI